MKIKYWYILFLSLIILFFMKKCVEQFENGDGPENADDSENSESAENTDPSIEGPSFNMCTCNSLCKLKNVGSDDIVRNIDCSLPMKAFSGTPQETTIYNKNHFCTLCNNIVKDKCRIRDGQELSDNDPIKRADRWCELFKAEQNLDSGVLERCPSDKIVGGKSKWKKYKFKDAYPMVLVNYMLEKNIIVLMDIVHSI